MATHTKAKSDTKPDSKKNSKAKSGKQVPDQELKAGKAPIEHFDSPDAPIPSAAPLSGGEPAPLGPREALSSDPTAHSRHVEAYAPLSNADAPEASGLPGITEIRKDATSEEIEDMVDSSSKPVDQNDIA